MTQTNTRTRTRTHSLQLERDQANPAHPLNRFATGNKFTLETNTRAQGIDVRQRLLDFHSTYYSSRAMTLCVR